MNEIAKKFVMQRMMTLHNTSVYTILHCVYYMCNEKIYEYNKPILS